MQAEPYSMLFAIPGLSTSIIDEMSAGTDDLYLGTGSASSDQKSPLSQFGFLKSLNEKKPTTKGMLADLCR